MDVPSRTQAIDLLERGRSGTMRLIERLPTADIVRPGIGGGEWSAKDLLGHLASWEGYALEALDAWSRGERAPIDERLYSRKLSDINAEAVARYASLTWAEVSHRADETHERLLAEIDALSDRRWKQPATPRGRKPLGHRLGQILTGPKGPFTHDQAHLKSLRAFVAERTAA